MIIIDNYCVYVHTNKINNKIYVGITNNIERRWRSNGIEYKPKEKNTSSFWNAIEKYGWDNFQHIIIAEGLSEQDAIKIEEELIAKYDTTNRDKGYNILYKGDATTGLKGELHPLFNKNLSDEHRNKISETRIERGVAKGKNNPSAKAVICITTNQIFDTMKEASKYYKTCDTGISMCCKGKRKSAGKLEDGTPLVWMYLQKYLDDNKIA